MVTLAEAKAHLRISPEEDHFNDEVQGLLTASIDHLSSIDVDMDLDPLPPAIRHAVLLLIGHFFSNKEATSAEGIRFTPIGVDRLIAPYRKMSL